ncbi:MAG: TonB family protein [Bacteroidales bacterium]|nr:TonB family protein [Bacteroidales bacterium]
MKSFIRGALVLAAAVCPAFSYAQYRTDRSYDSLYDSENVTSFKEQIGYVSSAGMEGRAPGSDGEKAAAEYIYERLASAGVEMLCGKSGDTFGISVENGDTLVSRNVVGFVQGYDKNLKDRYIVVGARLDNLGVNHMTVDGMPVDQIYYGANGNASGLAMLTELARMVSTNAIMFRRSVIFVAFGASTSGYAGAWYFLNRSFGDVDRIDAMLNLDMLGTGDNGFYAYTASNADLNSIIGNVANELQPVKPSLVAQEPYPSDHRAFYSMEIPSIMLTSGKYPEHNTPRDTESIIDYEMLEKELEYTYNLTLAVANAGSAPSFRPLDVPRRGPSYDDVVSVSDCDIKPMFLNSDDPRQFLEKWVYQYLRYPKAAVENGIQGRVLVDFIIDKDGNVTDVKVVRGVDQLLDDEAVRVISASPKWRPGRLKGNKVRTSMTIPVEFRLEKKGGKASFGIKR